MKYIPTDKLIAEIKIIQNSLERRDVRLNQVKKIRTECSIEFCKCIIDVITSLQQEQPEVDLDAEIAIYLNRNVLNRINNSDIIEDFTTIEAGELACHFYELGLNARKEGTK